MPLKAKLASRNGLGRTLACWLSVWNASQSFHASSGSDADQRGELRDRVGVIGLELLRAAELRGVEQRGPVDPGRLLLELGAGPDLRALGEVLALLARGVGAGDLRFEIEDAVGGALRIAIAGQPA